MYDKKNPLINNIKICHLSSAHPWEDVRIFYKECTSLAKDSSYEVSLISGNGENVKKNNVVVYSVPSTPGQNRFARMRETVNGVYSKALEVDAEVYHLHDPELLRIALKLKRKGKIVIYDAHEDLPRQILGKYWIPKMLRKLLSYSFEQYEDYIVKRLDAVVAATPFIKERFEKINKNVIDVNNYPILVKDEVKQLQSKGNYLCYAGGISANRGILDLIKAMDLLPDLKLKLAGRYSPEEFRKELTLVEGWGSVEELGYITRQEIRQLIKGSIVGLVTLKPLPNYLDSLPIKMFEYMYEGIPVIASNFPLWKKIVEGNKCGVCVNPESPKEIAEAVKMFVENPNMAAEMGKNGREMVWNKYNWTIEEGKLIALYKSLLLK